MAKLILSEIEAEELLCEIISGKKIFYHKDRVMALRQPSSNEKDSSKVIYVKKYKELVGRGIQTKDELKILMIKSGVFESDFYVKLKRIEQEIKKISRAREKTGSAMQMAQIEADLRHWYNEYYELSRREDVVMMNSAEFGAEMYRMGYLISKCTLTGYELEDRYWDTYEDFLAETDYSLVLTCRDNYRSLMEGMPAEKIRAVARSDDWRKRWDVSKKTGTPVFDGNSSNWDKNKIDLCYWTNFYDNIIERFKLAGSDILDDDDALFEMLRQNRNGQISEDGGTKPGEEKMSVKTPYKVRY
jgi:hypothetical protein